MRSEKFVVRLQDADGALLAWDTVYASAKPQEKGGSCPFFPDKPTQFVIERDGLASVVTVHWCDLDVARTRDIGEVVPVTAGTVLNFAWLEPVWVVPGMRDIALPPVTVRLPQAIPVPVGTIIGGTE